MAWTTPRTWAVGELATAANLNLHIRDNLSYLYDQADFIMYSTRTTLGGAAATMSISSIPATWEILRCLIYTRTATAATTDTIRVRFGDAALDTTAGNYYSYMSCTNTTTPTHTVSENLGATAGIGGSGIYVPGNTATASYFGFIELIIFGGSVSAGYKNVLVRGGGQWTNATGNIMRFDGYGQWLNTAKQLTQISVIATSGANLAANSWMTVFTGNC